MGMFFKHDWIWLSNSDFIQQDLEVGHLAFQNPIYFEILFFFLLWLMYFPTGFLPVNAEWLISGFKIDEKW